jgi:hypothetical protein
MKFATIRQLLYSKPLDSAVVIMFSVVRNFCVRESGGRLCPDKRPLSGVYFRGNVARLANKSGHNHRVLSVRNIES